MDTSNQGETAADNHQLPALLAWATTVTGAQVQRHARLATVRPAWKIDMQDGRQFILRCARASGFGLAQVYTLQREAAVLQSLARLPLPIPRVIAVHAEPDAILLEFMPGSADFPSLDQDPQHKTRVVQHFIALLSALHRAAPAQLQLDTVLPLPAGPRAHALADLEVWERLYRDAAAVPDALLLFALGWLRRHAPETDRTVLVQGDTGPNQCLFDRDGITAVLDWELAHFGDPMEDLGWIAARSFFMDFGDLRQVFALYSELSEIPLALDRLRYYRIMALVKCAIATGLARATMGPADDLASIVAWDAVNRRALTLCLMEWFKQDEGSQAQPLASPRDTTLYRLLAQVFETDAATATNAFESARRQGLAQIVGYLCDDAAQRGRLDALDAIALAELARRTNTSSADVAALVAAADPGHDIALTRYFHERETREIALLRPALGTRVQCLVAAID